MTDKHPSAWDINQISDLILGPGDRAAPRPPALFDTLDFSKTPLIGDDLAELPGCTTVVAAHPSTDVVRSVSGYADYWADRGQGAGVVWLGQSGIKVGLFGCGRQEHWAVECVDALEAGQYDRAMEVLHEAALRLILAVSACGDWMSRCAARAGEICVVLEPQTRKLIGGYEVLKTAAMNFEQARLSCFAVNVPSADCAVDLRRRLEDMGQRFLGRPVFFEGFTPAGRYPGANLMAETFVGGDQAEALHRELLRVKHVRCRRHTTEESFRRPLESAEKQVTLIPAGGYKNGEGPTN